MRLQVAIKFLKRLEVWSVPLLYSHALHHLITPTSLSLCSADSSLNCLFHRNSLSAVTYTAFSLLKLVRNTAVLYGKSMRLVAVL